MTSTDLAEYGRVFAAAFLGIAVTNETSILRLLIAFATLTYMVGKAALVWHHPLSLLVPLHVSLLDV